MLRSIVLTLNNYPSWNMGNANCRIGLINVLASCTRRPVSINTQIFFFDFNFYRVINYRINPSWRKTSMTTSGTVIRRNPNQSMYSTLCLQPTISVSPCYFNSNGFDPCFITYTLVNIFNIKPRESHHLLYILNNISAQSWASVPPAPAWISK